jgi:hypothetical protein
MDLMDLLNNWKKISGMNSPMLPGQPPQATPPFVPQPGQGGYQPQSAGSPFGNKTPPMPEPITPPSRDKVGIDSMLPEVGAPERQKVGIDSMLQPATAGSAYNGALESSITAPTRDRKSGIAEQKWYKDGDFMNELGGRLSNAFGSLTLRGNSPGEEKANMLKIAGAQQNRQKNKTMDYITKNNPEMAQKLMQLPPEMREQYMQLAMKSNFAGADESAFAEKVRMIRQANPNLSQAEAISQAQSGSGTNISVSMGGGAKPFEQELGTKAAEWFGKRNKAYSDIGDLDRVIGTIETAMANGDQLSGGIINYLPDDAKDLFNAEGQDVRRSVEKVIQASLKDTLGAQFAEREGRQIFERTWNPKAPTEYNLRRVRQLHGELSAYAKGQDALMNGMLESDGNILEYMRNNPEMAFSNSDSIQYLQYDDAFDAGITPEPAATPDTSGAPKAGGIVMDGKTYYYNEATGEYETDD